MTPLLAPVHALVIVDAQMGLLDGPRAVPRAGAVIDHIGVVLRQARHDGALVVHLQHDGGPGALDHAGSPGWCIHPARAPLATDAVIAKTTDDGFAGTGLDELLRAAHVERFALAGLLSEMCVSATARSGLALGYQIVLVRNGHATYALDDIADTTVSRVAEHALGDAITLTAADQIAFASRGVR